MPAPNWESPNWRPRSRKREITQVLDLIWIGKSGFMVSFERLCSSPLPPPRIPSKDNRFWAIKANWLVTLIRPVFFLPIVPYIGGHNPLIITGRKRNRRSECIDAHYWQFPDCSSNKTISLILLQLASKTRDVRRRGGKIFKIATEPTAAAR